MQAGTQNATTSSRRTGTVRRMSSGAAGEQERRMPPATAGEQERRIRFETAGEQDTTRSSRQAGTQNAIKSGEQAQDATSNRQAETQDSIRSSRRVQDAIRSAGCHQVQQAVGANRVFVKSKGVFGSFGFFQFAGFCFAQRGGATQRGAAAEWPASCLLSEILDFWTYELRGTLSLQGFPYIS